MTPEDLAAEINSVVDGQTADKLELVAVWAKMGAAAATLYASLTAGGVPEGAALHVTVQFCLEPIRRH